MLFGSADLRQIRELLHDKIRRTYLGSIDKIINHPCIHYQYYKTQITALALFADAMEKYYPKHPTTKEGYPMAHDLLIKDLKSLNLPAAAIAWVSTDGWRWHNDPLHSDLTHDINYGMVLKYPEPITRLAAYAAGLRRKELEETINKDDLEDIERRSLVLARRNDPDFEPLKYTGHFGDYHP